MPENLDFEAKWEDPEIDIKEPHTNCSARAGSQGTRKIAQDLFESIDNIYPWKTGLLVNLTNNQKKKKKKKKEAVSD